MPWQTMRSRLLMRTLVVIQTIWQSHHQMHRRNGCEPHWIPYYCRQYSTSWQLDSLVPAMETGPSPPGAHGCAGSIERTEDQQPEHAWTGSEGTGFMMQRSESISCYSTPNCYADAQGYQMSCSRWLPLRTQKNGPRTGLSGRFSFRPGGMTRGTMPCKNGWSTAMGNYCTLSCADCCTGEQCSSDLSPSRAHPSQSGTVDSAPH